MSSVTETSRHGPGSRMLLLTALMLGLLYGTEVDIFTPGFPEIQRLFSLSPVLIQLTLSTNFTAFCLSCLFSGPLGDRFGRRQVIIASLTLFVLGSILCVISRSFPMMLAGRTLQGLGIAAPSVLCFVMITDYFPVERQPTLMSFLSAAMNIGSSVAPAIGSYVNLLAGWRGNFCLLLALGVTAWIFAWFSMPSEPRRENVSLSPVAYLPLLRSGRFLVLAGALGLLCIPWWVFAGMAPILYMEDLGIPLKYFGFYMGSISGIYGVCSLLTPWLLERFGRQRSFRGSLLLCLGCVVMFAVMIPLEAFSGVMISIAMTVFSLTLVIPCNLLYPAMIRSVTGASGRAAALYFGGRLLLTAFFLEAVSWLHDGSFRPTGIFVALCVAGFLGLAAVIVRKRWMDVV